jgi:dienelactone hydrolase
MAAAGGSPFAAAVAYYPACLEAGSPMTTDTLILIGDADDWTPAENCRRWVTRAQTNGHVLDLKIYPGARHAFDGTLPLRSYFGHMLGRDDIAAPLAEAEVKKFFAQRLMN